MELSEAAIAAIKMALEPAVRLIGERSAEMAALIILGHGIDSAHMPLEDIMVVGATARIGSLAAMGSLIMCLWKKAFLSRPTISPKPIATRQ